MDGAREHEQEPGESGGLRECVEGAGRSPSRRCFHRMTMTGNRIPLKSDRWRWTL